VGASAEHHENDLMKEVTAIGDALSKAMVENDVEYLLGMYAEGAISLPNFGPRMQGIDAFRQSHEQMAAAGMKVLSFESEPTEAWQAGDQVIEIGTFAIELQMPGMPRNIEDKGKYLTIYVREEGSLKIKVETWNTDMNPMQMTAGMSGSQEGEPMSDGRED
jgi:ketosteroid isomerase-like protein